MSSQILWCDAQERNLSALPGSNTKKFTVVNDNCSIVYHGISYLVLPLKAGGPAVATLPSSPWRQRLHSSAQVVTLRQDISQQPLFHCKRPDTGREGIRYRPGRHAESAGAGCLMGWKWIGEPSRRWGARRGEGRFVWKKRFWRWKEEI